MIFGLNVRYSVRCSECGKKLDCAADTNPQENYDVILVVEPHDCSRPTPRALDGACESCKLELTPSCPIRTGNGCDLFQPRQ